MSRYNLKCTKALELAFHIEVHYHQAPSGDEEKLRTIQSNASFELHNVCDCVVLCEHHMHRKQDTFRSSSGGLHRNRCAQNDWNSIGARRYPAWKQLSWDGPVDLYVWCACCVVCVCVWGTCLGLWWKLSLLRFLWTFVERLLNGWVASAPRPPVHMHAERALTKQKQCMKCITA